MNHLLSRQQRQRILLMATILLFQCHSLEFQAWSDTTREVFSTRVTRGFISNSGERKGGSFAPQPSNNLQHKKNSLATPTNCGGCEAPTACKFTKQKGICNSYFCDFCVHAK
jgi:hypothetical protein